MADFSNALTISSLAESEKTIWNERRFQDGDTAVKCPSCGAENPEYAFYCGKCAAEMKGGSASKAKSDDSDKPRSTTKIESILSRNILRIEENAAKKRRGALGKFRGAFWRSGTLVFKSEREEVTLSIDREGHASVNRGMPPNPGFELMGPHDSFLTMFSDERNVRSIPGSIVIRLGGRELPDEMSQRMFREGIERLLRALFE